MLTISIISALLFLAVTSFCHREGLFASGSMGIGQLFAFALYLFVWGVPSAVMFACHWLGA